MLPPATTASHPAPTSPAMPAAPDDYAFASRRLAWFAVAVFCALQLSSNMDRQVISLVVEPLRRDFGLDDIQIGLLQGLAFALFYAVVAIPIGWAADRWRRNRIILVGASVWTLATLFCMVAPDYPWLFAARMMVGLGEAALVPAAFSMLGDYFPRGHVAGAVSIVTGASFFGAGCALAFGGVFVDQLPIAGMVELPWAGPVHGWQLAFGLVSLPGLLLLPIVARLREPPRKVSAGAVEAPTLREVAEFVIAGWRFWLPLLVGMILMATYQYGMTAWVVAFFMRVHGWTTGDIGLLYGLYFMSIGTGASLFGGWWCNRLASAGRRDATLVIPLVAGLAALPLTLAFAMTRDATLSAALLGVLTFFGVISFGPGMSAYQLYAPNRMRAQLTAFHVLLSTLVGGGLGPWLTAYFTERVFRDPQALPQSMALAAATVLLPAILALSLGMRAARRQAVPGAS